MRLDTVPNRLNGSSIFKCVGLPRIYYAVVVKPSTTTDGDVISVVLVLGIDSRDIAVYRVSQKARR